MDIENVNGYTLKNLNKINILLGKNGCGKSFLLREVEKGLSSKSDSYGKTKYITPERGGSLVYEAGIEQSTITSTTWLSETRRKNQFNQFKQQSVAQFRKLETIVLSEIEKEKREEKYFFDQYIDEINSLLDRIYIKRSDIKKGEIGFKIFQKDTNKEVSPDTISSGESELISLGIECLIFSKELVSNKEDIENILFLDEPDVHLHPDLQFRLMQFLVKLVEENNFKVLIATHSTAILGALESYQNTHIAFMTFYQKNIEFSPISDVYRKILPVFGAHPLSNIFNEAPILLLEGEDDERIWQQVVRSSRGNIKVYPCSCGDVDKLNEFEKESQRIINSVYDKARAYSLRDRDDSDESIEDSPPIIRMKLSCRNAENLLLSDEILFSLGSSWDNLKKNIDEWLEKNTNHIHYPIMKSFKESGYERKNFNLKEIRNDLMGIMGSSKPWEVAIGHVIAELNWNETTNFSKEGSVYNFLGEKIVKSLCPHSEKK
jgi:energy-coupling factor transporter ATP-binding protein EcfA2